MLLLLLLGSCGRGSGLSMRLSMLLCGERRVLLRLLRLKMGLMLLLLVLVLLGPRGVGLGILVLVRENVRSLTLQHGERRQQEIHSGELPQKRIFLEQGFKKRVNVGAGGEINAGSATVMRDQGAKKCVFKEGESRT